jgi:hypothetical protein
MNHPFRPVADGDGECAICHNGIGSTVHAEGREGVDRMSLQVACGEVHACSSTSHDACEPHAAYRPATREDVLAAVSDLGGERVDWCEVHSVSAKRPDLCWGASDSYARGHVPARCRIIPQLRVPLDTGDTE